MNRTLIRGGRILSLDRTVGEIPCGDVLIEDRKIAAIGREVPAAHGWPADDPAGWMQRSTRPHPEDLRRLRRERVPGDHGLITLAMAARGPDSTTMEVAAGDMAMARELRIRITMHVFGQPGSGSGSVERLHESGLLGPDVTLVHVTGAGDEALALMAAHGVGASVSPQIELTMRGLGAPAIGRLLAAGVRTSLSVDSETATAADMFTQMRMALAAQRAAGGHMPPVPARDVLDMATLEGARVTGLDGRTGSLAPGKDADIILVRTGDVNLSPMSAPPEAVVLAAHPGNVDTVLVAGRLLKRGGRLLADLGRVRALAQASLDHLRGAAG